MINLLNANFIKLKKSKLFLIMNVTIIFIALLVLFNQYNEFKNYGTKIHIDTLFGFLLIVIGIIISLFTALFLSIEYKDNTIRNKIIIGAKRTNIYLSNLLTIILVSIFFELIYSLIIGIIGIPLFGLNFYNTTYFIYILIMTQIIIITNASIYTFISMVCGNAILINVICILVALGPYFSTLMLMEIIDTPKYITSATITNSLGEIKYIKEKNPRYPSKTKKEICKFIMDILPQHQSLNIVSEKVENKKRIYISSLITFIIITSTGLIIFNKKELK